MAWPIYGPCSNPGKSVYIVLSLVYLNMISKHGENQRHEHYRDHRIVSRPRPSFLRTLWTGYCELPKSSVALYIRDTE